MLSWLCGVRKYRLHASCLGCLGLWKTEDLGGTKYDRLEGEANRAYQVTLEISLGFQIVHARVVSWFIRDI
jgi:hypothetical protein